uniref:Dishevelled segment polarity protein 2 n=1 Tax=Esox lucius TaxID=8010 RepID=A0AAY5L8N1_ESOLU
SSFSLFHRFCRYETPTHCVFGVEVNDINFDNMSNDDVVHMLREIIHRSGPIILAKCWDPSPQGYFTFSLNEPIRPIDPAAWVSHSVALTGVYPPYTGSSALSTITSSSSVTETERQYSNASVFLPLFLGPVRDRMWLKITIPNAFLGSDVVEWLYHHIEGFQDRREARKYASNLLKAGFIRHTVNKITFSEQCYYIFGDFSDCENCESRRAVSLGDHLGPPQPVTWHRGGRRREVPFWGWEGGDSRSGSSSESEYSVRSSLKRGKGTATSSKHSHSSQCSHHHRMPPPHTCTPTPPGMPLPYNPMMLMMVPQHPHMGPLDMGHPHPHPSVTMHPGIGPSPVPGGPPGAPPTRDLGSVPPELTASRQSFHLAMGNPSEFFVDVM